MLGFAVMLWCFPLLRCVSNAKFLMICLALPLHYVFFVLCGGSKVKFLIICLALPLHCVFRCYVVGLRYAWLCRYIVFSIAMLWV